MDYARGPVNIPVNIKDFSDHREALKISTTEGTSAGEAKNRLNVAAVLLGDEYDKTVDVASRFFIALEDPQLVTHNKPLVAGFGKVALKIGQDGEGKDAYAILNINSLKKRFLLTHQEINVAEKDGTLADKISVKMRSMIKQEEEITENFATLKTSDDNGAKLPAGLALVKFVKENFTDDKFLIENADGFIRQIEKNEKDAKTTEYIDYLKSKLWWEVDDDVVLDKRSIIEETLPGCYFGEGHKLDGNAGKAMRRLNLFLNDEKGRYSIALKHDFIYGKKPEAKDLSNDEVAIYWPDANGWLIVSANSLKRIGITESESKAWSNEPVSGLFLTSLDYEVPIKSNSHFRNLLTFQVLTRNEELGKFNEEIRTVKASKILAWVKAKEKIHPDKQVQELLRQFLDKPVCDAKGNELVSKNRRDLVAELEKIGAVTAAYEGVNLKNQISSDYVSLGFGEDVDGDSQSSLGSDSLSSEDDL